jgi:hypothetical protein
MTSFVLLFAFEGNVSNGNGLIKKNLESAGELSRDAIPISLFRAGYLISAVLSRTPGCAYSLILI